MTDPKKTRDRAAAALLAAINSIHRDAELSENIVLLYSCVDELIAHAIAVAENDNPKQLATDADVDPAT